MARKLSVEERKQLISTLEARVPGFDASNFLTGRKVKGHEGIEWIESEGGGEGGAEDCSTIFSVDGKVYRWLYSYYSHYGYEIDEDISEVTPKRVEVTVYE